jgi:hypothetical protein
MKCDWIFLARDTSRQEATLEESALPRLGDRREHQGKGYEVFYVAPSLPSGPNPVIIAAEWLVSLPGAPA